MVSGSARAESRDPAVRPGPRVRASGGGSCGRRSAGRPGWRASTERRDDDVRPQRRGCLRVGVGLRRGEGVLGGLGPDWSNATAWTVTASPRVALIPAALETRALSRAISGCRTAEFTATETVWRFRTPAGMVVVWVVLLTALFFVTLSDCRSRCLLRRCRRPRCRRGRRCCPGPGRLRWIRRGRCRSACRKIRSGPGTWPGWLNVVDLGPGLGVHVRGDGDRRVARSEDLVQDGLDVRR